MPLWGEQCDYYEEVVLIYLVVVLVFSNFLSLHLNRLMFLFLLFFLYLLKYVYLFDIDGREVDAEE